MKVRMLATMLVVACAAALAVPMGAMARTNAPAHTSSMTNVPVTGKAHNGKRFSGHFRIDKFISRSGKTYALGTLTGRVGHRTVRRSNVAMPVSVQRPLGTAHSAATCPILHLDLGPLALNLLGLNVHLNEVVLDITATSGPGLLLGNLLCGIANLLNGPTALGQQVAGLLNIVQQLVGSPGLLNL
jgi:hypothetical protein